MINSFLQKKHHFAKKHIVFLKTEFKRCRFPSNERCEEL